MWLSRAVGLPLGAGWYLKYFDREMINKTTSHTICRPSVKVTRYQIQTSWIKPSLLPFPSLRSLKLPSEIVIVNTASYYFQPGPDVVFIQVKLSMGLNSLPFHCQLVEIFYWILIWRATSWKKGLEWTGLILCRAWTRQFFWLKGEL